jgi:hypothetical protein
MGYRLQISAMMKYLIVRSCGGLPFGARGRPQHLEATDFPAHQAMDFPRPHASTFVAEHLNVSQMNPNFGYISSSSFHPPFYRCSDE